MIGDREQVYENIRTAVSLNQLNSKVEPGDPKLLREDKEALLRHYIDYRTAQQFQVHRLQINKQEYHRLQLYHLTLPRPRRHIMDRY